MSNATLLRGLHHAKVCLIPLPANNHRPLVLRHRSLTAISMLLLLAKLLAISILALTPTEAELSTITANRIVQLTNQERVDRGLTALSTNSKLTEAAQMKANDMIKNQYFAHISPTGVTPWYWMQKTGYAYEIAGENLAIDFSDAEDVVSAWLASPKHKENMLRPDYAETGIAIASGNFKGATSIVVVHMFGKPLETVVQPTPEPVAPSILSLAQAKTFVAVATPAPTPAATPVATPTPTPTPTPIPAPVENTVLPAVSSIILSPAFDREEFAVPSNTADAWQLFSTHSSIAINNDVISAVPLFTIHPESQSSTTFPATISRINREFTGSILIAISALLLIAIFVRIRIQHPFMIAHASLVVVLAFALLLA